MHMVRQKKIVLKYVYQDDPSAVPYIKDTDYQLTAFMSIIWPAFIEEVKKELVMV